MKNFNKKIAITSVVILCLLELSGVGYLTFWRETFWNYVEQKNSSGFFLYLGYFSIVAISLAAVTGYTQYLLQLLALDKRRELTRMCFKLKKRYTKIEGFAQRVQEDAKEMYWLQYQLAKAFSVNIVYVMFYSWLIVHEAGTIYLIIPTLYALLGTYFGFSIAKPLIALNYVNQVAEAAFRKQLTRLNYAKAHRYNFNLYKRLKYLGMFQYFFNQLSVIFPYVLVAGLYFSAKITFGTLMQLASAISHLVDSMSVLVNSFSDINKYLACRKRLKELDII